MLTTGWHSTIPGVTITVSSVALNCLLYMAIADLLWVVIRAITHG
jgi:hypothetical protein